MTETELLKAKIAEYRNLLPSTGDQSTEVRTTDQIRKQLAATHDWTDGGAETLVKLARDYGAFMLSNALALAIVIDQEDGDLGV
jgi:hypothetical protein